MLSKNHPIILFIDRFGFSVYQDVLANIPKFNFTPDLVSNLDVVSKEQFTNIIATFIQINKIVPSSLAVILSDDIIYIRDIENPVQKTTLIQDLKLDVSDDKGHEDDVQNFLENIPFEEVLAKVIKTGNVNRIVAVNKDLVMAIINVFVGKGSTIEAITPSFMYGQNANFTTGLTSDNIRVILENTEILKLGNLLINQEKIIPFQDLGSELKNSLADVNPSLANDVKKPQNFRQYMLIGLLVTLLVIFVVVYLNLGVSQTPPKSSKEKNIPASAVNIPTVIPTLTQILIPIAPVDSKDIKIIIVQNSQAGEKANNLKNGLLNIGFQDISNEISEISTPEKSSVVFSKNIPSDLRNSIIIEVKKILPDISILENQDSDRKINIIVGKS